MKIRIVLIRKKWSENYKKLNKKRKENEKWINEKEDSWIEDEKRGQVISFMEAWEACGSAQTWRAREVEDARGVGYIRVQAKLNNIDGKRKLKAIKVFSVAVRNGCCINKTIRIRIRTVFPNLELNSSRGYDLLLN